ncbi:MAG: hypothetical protein F6K16_01135 [Symploca sp. SIO2B6]|nr:hypothetical protein [Symploca sp. SIO2B6]
MKVYFLDFKQKIIDVYEEFLPASRHQADPAPGRIRLQFLLEITRFSDSVY